MPRKYPFELDPFGRAFVEHRDCSLNEQIAYGLLESARHRPIDFPENCLLPTVGPLAINGASYFTFGSGICYQPATYEELQKAHPEHSADLAEIAECVRQASTWYRGISSLTPYEKRLTQTHVCWGGTWIGHGNPDYYRVLHLGTDGFRTHIAECQAKNPGRDGFYHAAELVLDAIDLMGDRIAAHAAAQAKKDLPRQAEWLRIAEDFRRIPRQPAYDMHSAVLLFWLFFTFDGIDSPGRLDQCMIDYYRISPVTESEEMITRMLEAIHNVRAWNLCISGSDEKWQDETNELSYLILRKVTEMGYQTPNLTMRVHRNTPEKLWQMATDCLATGIGLPALYNDEVVCPALEKLGIPPEDSHDYCMNGCNQIDIMGKSHMGLEDGEVNLAKVLELTLHDGRDYAVSPPELIAPQFGSIRKARTFEEFLACYYQMLDHITDTTVAMSNRCQQAFAQFAPNPLRDITIQGCLEKGLDYTAGGPLYGHGQVLAEGIADAADSLWAVRKLVYEKKKYTLDELIDALEVNYEGHEALRHDFQSCEKFGNDIPEVDELCAEITDHLFQRLKCHRTFRGGIFTGGCSPFDRAAANGRDTAALPNGKRHGECNFADSIAATPGNDLNGPTASLKSMMHYRQTEAGSGFIAQMKFTKSLFCTTEGKDAFQALAKTYFANGGQQLSINVLDRETLLKAKAEPEKYKSLVVRVGGYSEYFCNLTPELQQNVIDRTSFAND